MMNEERDILCKLRVLPLAEKIGNAYRACRYFGVGKSRFYQWWDAYQKHGDAVLKNAKSIPKNPANQTPLKIMEKVLYFRSRYRLRSIWIVQYLARYHDIKISDAGAYRILRHNGLNRLPRGTSIRKLHNKLYQRQVPTHHIQVDVMFLTFIGKTVRRFVGSNTLPSTMRPEFAPSRFTRNIGRQTLSTSLTTSLKSYRSESAKYDPTMAISSKQSNIGMLKISGSGTRTSNVERQSGALSPLLSVGILQAAQSQR